MGDRFESILQARATAREQARGNRGRAVSRRNGGGNGAGKLNGDAPAGDGGAAPDRGALDAGDAGDGDGSGGDTGGFTPHTLVIREDGSVYRIDHDESGDAPAAGDDAGNDAGGGEFDDGDGDDATDWEAIGAAAAEALRELRELRAQGPDPSDEDDEALRLAVLGKLAAHQAARDFAGGNAQLQRIAAADPAALFAAALDRPMRDVDALNARSNRAADARSALESALRKLGADDLQNARRLAPAELSRADALLWYDLLPAERRALRYARADSQALSRAAWALLTPADRTAYQARRNGAGAATGDAVGAAGAAS